MNPLKPALELQARLWVQAIKDNMARNNLNATGDTEERIRWVSVDENTVRIEIPAYLKYVETGRGPGKMPPVEPLIRWARARNLDFEKSAESVGFALAKKIAQRGTKRWFEGDRVDIFSNVITDQAFDSLTKKLADTSLELSLEFIDDNLPTS